MSDGPSRCTRTVDTDPNPGPLWSVNGSHPYCSLLTCGGYGSGPETLWPQFPQLGPLWSAFPNTLFGLPTLPTPGPCAAISVCSSQLNGSICQDRCRCRLYRSHRRLHFRLPDYARIYRNICESFSGQRQSRGVDELARYPTTRTSPGRLQATTVGAK